MSHHGKSLAVIGAAAFLAFAPDAQAQAKPKPASTKRIPITKESPGEVVRVDTVTRVDTMQITNTVYRTDTLTVERLRVDTVTLVPPPVPIRLPNGFYFGIAAGPSAPDGSIYIPNSTGAVGQMQLGWQHYKQILGGRISGTYTGLGQDSQFSFGENAQLWTFSTDAKLNMPLGHVFGFTPRLAAYGIGGWTYTWFKHLPHRLDREINDVDLPSPIVLGNDSWTGRNGWDAGGGLSLNWGRSELFAEARVIGFSIENANQGRQIPIVLGFNWY